MKIHHIGYVVKSIEEAAAALPGLRFVERVFDPVQQAELALYALDNVHVEFICPAGEQSFTWRFLDKNGGGYHHLCYEVPDLETAQRLMREHRMVKVLGPVPALLFGGRQVLFAYARNKDIVEFLL